MYAWTDRWIGAMKMQILRHIEQLPQLPSSTASTVPFQITDGKMRPHWWETPYLLLNCVSTPWSSLASKSMNSQLLKMHGKANELGSANPGIDEKGNFLA
jgi:hypothetical protein